jgi:LysM repeat protein
MALFLLAAPPRASANFVHTVLPGESLSSIAAADGLSVAQLAAANGLAPDDQLILGSTVGIPPQGAPVAPSAPLAASGFAGDGDGDSDDVAAASPAVAAPAAASGAASAGSYLVQPGDTLTAIAARARLSLADLAAINGLDPAGTLLAGSVLRLSGAGGSVTAASTVVSHASDSGSYVVQLGDTLTAIAARAGLSVADLAAINGLDPAGTLLAGSVLRLSGAGGSAPANAPAVGTSVSGRMTWFGGPNDPNAQGQPASGLGWLGDGMAYYNSGSLRGRWLIHFPWGQTLSMRQIDLGPAPWTGNSFDMAFSALPNTPYGQSTWPNPTVTGTYEGP